ncbi:MAG: LamG domain-containing protein [Candidatus Levybacteria bacterium]|nr:LamG domain-containing protein [Candidatus Levybacteria bacterium]
MKKKILLSPLIILIIIIIAGVSLAGASLLIGNTGDNSATTAIDLQKGLVGWWKMDGNAKDSTPYRNNGTATNATLTTDRKGQVNKAYDFNGSNARINVTHNSSLNAVSNKISLAGWFRFDTVGVYQRLIVKTVGSPTNAGYSLEFHPGATDILRLRVGDGSGFHNIDSLSTLSADTWYHVVAVYDGTSGYIYLNGALDKQTDDAFTVNNSTATLQFGLLSTTTDPFDGQMDDVRFYNRALSSTEVTALYQEYDPGIQVSDLQKGLVGNWDFNGNAKDRTPNRKHGTVTDATLTTDRKGQANKAYSFNGSTAHIAPGSSSNFSFASGTSITLAAWVNANSGARTILSTYKSGGSGNQQNWVLARSTTGSSAPLQFYYRNSDDADYSYFQSTGNVLSTGTWIHVAVTYTFGTGSSAKLYVNGQEITAAWISGATGNNAPYETTSADIGSDKSGFIRFWSGNIDDVRIYRRALTSTEITALYDSYNPGVQISDLQKGLVGQWKMDGNAKDATPYRNHGTVTGATLNTDRKGQVNKAYDFNGTTAKIAVANGGPLAMLGLTELSVAFWIKTSGATDNDRYINKFANSPLRGFNIDNQDPGVVGGLRFEVFDGTTTESITDTGVMDVDTWTHVVVTWKAATASTGHKIYKNGSLKKQEGTVNATIGDNSGASLYMMVGSGGGGAFATGQMDDVRIYNRELTATEIADLYNSY